VFIPGRPFQLIIKFTDKDGAYPSRALFRLFGPTKSSEEIFFVTFATGKIS
jgi:hypothetical protein